MSPTGFDGRSRFDGLPPRPNVEAQAEHAAIAQDLRQLALLSSGAEQVAPDMFTVPVVLADPFALLQKYAEEFDLAKVSRMVRLAAPTSPLHGAAFKHTTAGEWSLKARPGVTPEAAAWELCRLLGLLGIVK